MKHHILHPFIPLLVAAAAAGCVDSTPIMQPSLGVAREAGGVPHRAAAAARDAVLGGNTQMVLAGPTLPPPGAPLTPFVEARLYAIASIAMHDALNSIVPRFDRYADQGPLNGDANANAAVLTAAHDAIAGGAPGAQAAVDAWYAAAMAAIAGDPGVGDGISIGHRAAAAILARRANDGTAFGALGPYVPGAGAGDYQFTFPFTLPDFNIFGTGGFADATIWGTTVTPFVVSSGAQFRAPPPYGAPSNAAAVLTTEYTSDFNEVKALGCETCTARTDEQTEIARFWAENSPTGWNRIARIVADQRNMDAWDAARLLAIMAMGEFDAYVTSLESKYHYNFWRPVTAVALAGNDGNSQTAPEVGWQVLVFPTPPVPDYPSAHSTAGGAGAAIIEALVPGRGQPISTTSASAPNVTRTFESVASAASENALSRIYIGYHFRHATAVGLRQGRAVGAYVAGHALAARSGRGQ